MGSFQREGGRRKGYSCEWKGEAVHLHNLVSKGRGLWDLAQQEGVGVCQLHKGVGKGNKGLFPVSNGGMN